MSNFEKKIHYPSKGKYVLAVSGGLDSVSLLDILANKRVGPHYDLVVAHFDHGIRVDSKLDEKFVHGLAKKYRLPFTSTSKNLGPKASEATARTSRYKFLEEARKKFGATAIVTAHHLDDRIETAVFNLQRGTGRRGLIPFRQQNILRPFKHVFRQELEHYANERKLQWREDPTNNDLRYSRNRIRHVIIPKFEKSDAKFKTKFASILDDLEIEHNKIESMLEKKLHAAAEIHKEEIILSRSELISMSHLALKEFLYYCILQINPNAEILKQQLERLANFCKVAKHNTVCPISGDLKARATTTHIILG